MAKDQTQRHINSSSTGGAGGSGSGGGGGGGGSGSGGRGGGDAGKSCNKSKQKKVPQRGLGVAQLEKLRIQEQMKENAANLQPLQPPMFLQPPNSALYSGPRQHGLIPSSEAGSNSMSTSGSEMGWPGSCWVCVRWPNLQGQCQNLDYRTVQSNTGHLPCNLQHPAPSPMVNIPAGPSKAPMWNFQPQPPPNQFYGGNYYTPEEERMVGMKRSYDQSAMEDTPGSCAAFIQGRAKTAHHNDGSTTPPAHTMVLREFPILPDPKKKKVMNEFEGSNGDFLTLAPPKIELPQSYQSPHHQEVTDSDAQPYQGTRDEPTQQPFFTFLPSAKSDSDRPEDDEEEVDLNLKL